MSLDATEPVLPALEAGPALLETDDRATGPLQSLVIDQLLTHDEPAYWVDGRRDAVTSTLARLAPGGHLLERIRVARGFTAYQHHALLDRLAARCSERSPAVVVLPAIAFRYLEDDVRGDADRLFESALATVARLRECVECPILVTTSTESCPAALASLVDQRITYERTEFGPRFVGEEFETLVYPAGDGTVQTTLAFWAEVLARRHETTTTATPEMLAHGAD